MKHMLFITLGLFMHSILVFAQLDGVYSIDPSKPPSSNNYQDFASAVNDLKSGYRDDGGIPNGWGVSDSVIFEIADGVYDVALSLPQITGVSETSRIIFKSASGDNKLVSLANLTSTENQTLYFNNGKYYEFHNVTIKVSPFNSTARAIYMTGTSQYNIFKGCQLIGGDAQTTSTSYSIIYLNSFNVRHNTFSGNHITYGSIGIYGYRDRGTLIYDNTFKHQYYTGIWVYQSRYPEILNNKISDPNPEYNYSYGCYFYNLYDSAKVIGNEIEGEYIYGIYNNYVNSGSHNGRVLIANNTISLYDYKHNSSSRGIYHRRSRNIDYYNNAIANFNTVSNGTGFYLDGSSSNNSNNNFLNNIFYSENSYAFDVRRTQAVNNSNHNSFYSRTSSFGYWSGSRNTLASWISASGKDANSVHIDPRFYSKNELRTLRNELNNGGNNAVLDRISTDKDGIARNSST
ncbi:MAG: right-handed parallel beta-helix repeat-containing protein, partial [Bacteroidales bacterium]|nr:right-handed parallel beta-helix repeat-containing protein [Bacteroidales bacterium]